MKKFIVCVGVIALVIGSGGAAMALSLTDNNGVLTVYDEMTGKSWYRNLGDFSNQSYDQQISSITGLNTNGYAGFTDWHMASYDEMSELWTYGSSSIMTYFLPSAHDPLNPGFYDNRMWVGRYDTRPENDCPYGCWDTQWLHNTAEVWWNWDPVKFWEAPWLEVHLDNNEYDWGKWYVGAWVVTQNSHPLPDIDPLQDVPEPATFLLVAVGLMMLTAIRRKL